MKHLKYHDCFALRFNLYKCGYIFPENIHIFAGMYGEDENFLKICLKDYEEINKQSADEILSDEQFLSYIERIKDTSVLFVGDSITSDRLSYGKILEKALNGHVIDGAVSSSRTIDLITVLDGLLAENKPDIISIMIGTNDSVCSDKVGLQNFTSAEEYKRNINIIIEKIKKSGSRIVLNAIPEADYNKFNNITPFRSVTKEINDRFNTILKNAANKNQLVYNDYREKMSTCDTSLLFEPDALHLSPFAHKIIAQTVLESIAKCIL